jgi:hypothetical protein
MEPAALEASLDFLKSYGLNITHLVTDRSSAVRTRMSDKFPEINHQSDPWHYVKNVKKQLWKDSKTKQGAKITEWMASITNMTWYSLGTSKGNPRLAREKLYSMFGHITGVHSFPLHELYIKCEHEELPEDRNKPYMKQGSPALQKVVDAVCGTNNHNIRDLASMDAFLHTGDLEAFNSLILKYMPKRIAYSVQATWVRTALAAMDNNNNVDR